MHGQSGTGRAALEVNERGCDTCGALVETSFTLRWQSWSGLSAFQISSFPLCSPRSSHDFEIAPRIGRS